MINKQYENLFVSADHLQKWNSLMLSNADQWIALGFDSVQKSVASGTQQMKVACSGLNDIHEPSQWSEITQEMVRNAIESTREFMNAATDFQIEAQQLFREQAAEVQKLVEASLTQQFSQLKSVEAEVKKVTKASSISQKLAA